MSMITASEARARILAAIKPLSCEDVDLAHGAGRYLGADIAALRTQPQRPLSAMDGYAVRHQDVAGVPVTLDVIGEVPAGRIFEESVEPGQAARIFTGAALPDGADCVVIQENTEAATPDNRDNGENTIRILETSPEGKHVRPLGLDFLTGDIVASRGTLLNARDIGLIAAAGGPTVSVHRRPRVAILATGDELVPPGVEPEEGQIVAGNTPMLAAAFEAAGALVTDLGIAPDRAEALREMAAGAADADLFITIGGASVGDYDLVQSALGDMGSDQRRGQGLETEFWKVAIKPGKPLIFGHMAKTPMIGLPGNPVSAYVCAVLFVLPAIRALQGAGVPGPVVSSAILGADMPAAGSREGYVRARAEDSGQGQEAGPVATPIENQDSSALSSLAAAGCLIIRPIGAAAAVKGDRVGVITLGA